MRKLGSGWHLPYNICTSKHPSLPAVKFADTQLCVTEGELVRTVRRTNDSFLLMAWGCLWRLGLQAYCACVGSAANICLAG